MSQASRIPLRADAARNLRRILTAAAEAFAEQGGDVAMEEVARRAGVGVGTLYRRFPDREALVVAVVRDSFQTLVDTMREAQQQEPRAWDALVRSMSHSQELRLSTPPSGPLAAPSRAALVADPVIRGLRDDFVEVLEQLVERAQAEGDLRDDVGAGDVAQLFALVVKAGRPGGGRGADLASGRALAVVLDGLRTGGRTTLPGRPLAPGDLARP
ncbi:TetR/AcrR family transcriptional regulator [Microlunatus sagamiharensis]|uniref:TetR/AcrR family transcriptional regulator n=1 Tax=Microlunatus sagamiharensis TaxID=546874 RepID=UPI000B89ADDB|nr:TetR/AcrR family transcriptional regulator [Microlunatus sagamiharensis]